LVQLPAEHRQEASKPGRPVPGLAGLAGQLPRLPDSPALPAAIAGALATLFVLVRLAIIGHGDPTRFVIAGRVFADPARTPSGLHIFPGTGYDGQFFFRLGLDPANLRHIAFGLRFGQ
jgi:hypothetical protein